MDYMNVHQAAKKWGVSVRWVQTLLKDGRIDGATRPSRDWLIPVNAEKPGDPRRRVGILPPAAGASLTEELKAILISTTLPVPRDNPEAVFDMIKDEKLRLIPEISYAYMKGDFEYSKKCIMETDGNDALKLAACSMAIPTAISAGDYPLYQEIEGWLKSIVQEDISAEVTAFAQWSLATGYISAFVPAMAPGWVKRGDFSAILPILKPNVAFLRTKYFQCIGEYDAMLATAQTALAFVQNQSEGKILYHIEIYLLIACAIACCGLGRKDEAKPYLLDAMNICLPIGAITPFAESAQAFGGLLEPLLENEFPSFVKPVIEQWERTAKNWIAFHNQFAKDNITQILSLRDYQISRLAVQGVSYKKIAEGFNLSVGTVKNIMLDIYGQLFISGKDRRKALAKLVL